jgi:hypothetical protein
VRFSRTGLCGLWLLYLSFRICLPVHCPGATRVSQVPGASLHASHALCGPRPCTWPSRTSADPRSTHHTDVHGRCIRPPHALFVLASGPLTPSPSAFETLYCAYSTVLPSPTLFIGAISSLRECGLPCGLRSSLCTLQLFRSVTFHLHNCNTRYGWVVNPYPKGAFTPSETPSFAWRTNGIAHLSPDLARRLTHTSTESCKMPPHTPAADGQVELVLGGCCARIVYSSNNPLPVSTNSLNC